MHVVFIILLSQVLLDGLTAAEGSGYFRWIHAAALSGRGLSVHIAVIIHVNGFSWLSESNSCWDPLICALLSLADEFRRLCIVGVPQVHGFSQHHNGHYPYGFKFPNGNGNGGIGNGGGTFGNNGGGTFGNNGGTVQHISLSLCASE